MQESKENSRSINDLKTYRDIIEKLVIPKLTAGMFTDTPVEVVDGVRKSFTVTRDFYPETLAIYIAGSRLHPDDYVVSGNRSINFITAPTAGAKIVFDYVPMDI